MIIHAFWLADQKSKAEFVTPNPDFPICIKGRHHTTITALPERQLSVLMLTELRGRVMHCTALDDSVCVRLRRAYRLHF